MLCILGSGAQARSHAEALKHVRSFSEVLYLWTQLVEVHVEVSFSYVC